MEPTYKIIGGDGREYGPIPLEELKHWIRDGRVAPATQVWRSESDAWSAAQEVPEVGTEWRVPSVPQITANPSSRASLWPRIGAILIDLVILEILARIAFGNLPEAEMNVLSDSRAYMAFVEKASEWFWNFLLLAGIYTIVFNTAMGATPGKLAIGSRILREDGAPLGFARACLRFVAGLFSFLIFGFGYLLVALREDKRALHDLISGTQVVYKR